MKILKPALFALLCLVLWSCSDGGARITLITVKEETLPPGTEIENTGTSWDAQTGQVKVWGEFVNNSDKKVPVQQITVDLELLSGEIDSSPVTSTGTDKYISPGARIAWQALSVCPVRPADAIIKLEPIF